MVIRQKYYQMFVRQMVVQQLMDEYKEKGYEVKEQYPIGRNIRADLYASKDGERVIIELTDKDTRLDQVDMISQIAQLEGAQFRIVNLSDIKIEEEEK